MKLSGWIMMMFYWGFVLGLVVFSYSKILTAKPSRRKS